MGIITNTETGQSMELGDPEAARIAELEAAFIALDRQYPTVKAFLAEYAEAKAKLAEAAGIGHHFMDILTGVVYEIDECKWKSVPMEHFTINATKREGEVKGSLSVKRAKELGYDLDNPPLPL